MADFKISFNVAPKFSISVIVLLLFVSGNVLFLHASKPDTVFVYGKNSCPYTKGTKINLALVELDYIYIDLDGDPESLKDFHQKTTLNFGANATLYLPVVEVNGKMLMRPNFSQIASLLNNPKSIEHSKMGSLSWRTDYKQALETARKENKFIIVNFAHYSCGFSQMLDVEVFDKKEFRKYFKDFILVRLEFGNAGNQDAETIEYNQKLSTEYKVKGYPAVFFLSPEGENLGKHGYREGGTASWISVAQIRLEPYKRRKKLEDLLRASSPENRSVPVILWGFQSVPGFSNLQKELTLAAVPYVAYDLGVNREQNWVMNEMMKKTFPSIPQVKYWPIVDVNGTMIMMPTSTEIMALLPGGYAYESPLLLVDPPSPCAWQTDFNKASAEAMSSNKCLLLLNTGSAGNPYYRQLQKNILNIEEFRKLADNLVLVKLDRTQFHPESDFIKKYGGQGRPMLYIFSPDGKPLGYEAAYTGNIEIWIKNLIKKLGIYYKFV